MVEITVQVEEGLLRGKEERDASGKPFYSFQGVPYARPPLGDLRFKVVTLLLRWALEFIACHGFGFFYRGSKNDANSEQLFKVTCEQRTTEQFVHYSYV